MVFLIFSKFFELFSVCDFGCWAHTAGDGYALDVVIFVLHGPCKKSFGLFGKFVAVQVGGGNFAFFISSDFGIHTRHR